MLNPERMSKAECLCGCVVESIHDNHFALCDLLFEREWPQVEKSDQEQEEGGRLGEVKLDSVIRLGGPFYHDTQAHCQRQTNGNGQCLEGK